MNSQEYIKYIEDKLSPCFIFEKNRSVFKFQYDLYGENKATIGRTLITQVDVIDKYEVNEYLFFKVYESMSLDDLNSLLIDFKEIACFGIEIKEYHKLSTLSLILIIDKYIDDYCLKIIEKFKYKKLYNFYWRGYCELRIIAICLYNNTFTHNKSFKTTQKSFTKILTS